MQSIRGQKFWKVDPSSAILPHDVVKQMGRPIMKRNREPDEARKRKSEWSQSRKDTQMTCGNCCEPNHYVRSCYKEKCIENNVHSRKGKRPMSVNTRSKLVHKSLLFDHKLKHKSLNHMVLMLKMKKIHL
ncbi:hypothetical protein AABB24_021452 [Solanum stoloniferum]|uniref:Uncharacterized protein n=1 Tax=Solanum stoloniferum TaxID=62892 RepID=A0ABD2SVU7_9SOLN